MKTQITKHDYILFNTCPIKYACRYFGPIILEGETGNPVKDFLTAQGQAVGILAQQLFLGIEGVEFEKKLWNGLLVTRPDVLNLKDNELIEIKSTTEVKEEHLLDVAFQKLVCDREQIQIDKIKLGHLNKNYIKNGALNIHELFEIEDVTSKVLPLLPQLENDLLQIEDIIIEHKIPKISIGPHCYAGEGCPHKSLCFNDHLNDTIFNLRRDSKGKRFDLFQNGIYSLKNIPDYVELTKYQELQKQAEIENAPIIDHNAIADALHEVVYPIFFLDFEAFAKAIPTFDKTSAYQQIPFQASIHRLKGKNLKPKHSSFLHQENSDPRRSLAKFLVKTLEEYGSIIVYHASYEKGRIYELISVAPELEKELLALIDRIWDLEEIFSKGMFVHPAFKGSTSIKKVLPVLCPELTYENLDINNGQLASVQYLKMISAATPKEEKEKIKNDLEAYCALDTYAMYAIYKKISELL